MISSLRRRPETHLSGDRFTIRGIHCKPRDGASNSRLLLYMLLLVSSIAYEVRLDHTSCLNLHMLFHHISTKSSSPSHSSLGIIISAFVRADQQCWPTWSFLPSLSASAPASLSSPQLSTNTSSYGYTISLLSETLEACSSPKPSHRCLWGCTSKKWRCALSSSCSGTTSYMLVLFHREL